MFGIKLLFRGILLLSLGACLHACNTVEGCMEPAASNFSPEADKNCCCNFYQLSLNLSHEADSGQAFAFYSPYPDADGLSFELKSAAILVSNVRLIGSDNIEYPISDSILLNLTTGQKQWFKNDFRILQPGIFISNLGSFVRKGRYQKIRFLVGLNSTASTTDAYQFTNATHALSATNSSGIFRNDAYRASRWEVILPNTQDTLFYGVIDPIQIELDYSIQTVDGLDTKIPVFIDYKKFFNGISFTNDDSTSIVQKIKNNTRNAFTTR